MKTARNGCFSELHNSSQNGNFHLFSESAFSEKVRIMREYRLKTGVNFLKIVLAIPCKPAIMGTVRRAWGISPGPKSAGRGGSYASQQRGHSRQGRLARHLEKSIHAQAATVPHDARGP